MHDEQENDTTSEARASHVRGLLLASSVATLSTLAAQRGIEGFPFGSVVPYACSAEGHLVVMLARIATHTANLRRDPRASLMVRYAGAVGDPQASWRVTVTGAMERLGPEGADAGERDVVLPKEAFEDLVARYVEKVPAAADYERTHDFDLWRLSRPLRVRYIGGFGDIHWLAGPDVLRDPGGAGLREAAPGAVAHMNEDHRANLLEMCAGLCGFRPEDAELVAIDRTGFQVVTHRPARRVHFSFGREIVASELRHAVIDVLRRARAAPR